ncbi:MULTISPECIES: hypothetical protein [Tenacibaculum]|uniref:Uncharacterized protein n=2 Tax=Tenacibaculum TaxID=104267 RepID=A0AAE9SFP5_9FLAO|nr:MULTISPECIES: hypothetical protein [Tenacibaculum]GFD73954.1 hypothetical protein KUL113_33740 [Tenacibaculum sp. KUL113]GFD80889.1 hypothetical protein KUL118_37510 [Tenacibaculum sp. KUL118]GFD92139.1 hypothetical protein KUL154_08720 [Alteromonas sp. KUL154]GFE00923.1 hypothetical protein KUL156_35150 [Alteromonas sp. KUL156]AZJ33731.1 hypothetical protein D6200_14605 [Tenacibaculum mesophilum]
MENIFRYYEFSGFLKDNSGTFQENEISFSELNKEHFLIFEKKDSQYNLYVSKYSSKKSIGKEPPEILELLIENYDKSIPEHRIVLRKYLY